MTEKKFIPRTITPALAAEGYNNQGRGKLIGYIADPAKHEKDCPYRRDESCSCRIGLWQDSVPKKGGRSKKAEFNAEPLSPSAIEVLGQLYVSGPTWDGNICSKNGRGELCRAGLAWHQHGYASLTPDGVRAAAEWEIADLRRRRETRWLQKRQRS